jgi:hypothetical protein
LFLIYDGEKRRQAVPHRPPDHMVGDIFVVMTIDVSGGRHARRGDRKNVL